MMVQTRVKSEALVFHLEVLGTMDCRRQSKIKQSKTKMTKLVKLNMMRKKKTTKMTVKKKKSRVNNHSGGQRDRVLSRNISKITAKLPRSKGT